jgi:hypothetical protein
MKVFINYSSQDEALATQLVATLEDAGLDAWFKKREILPGDNWAEKISQGLKESNAMVVLFSRDALDSDAVQSNISFALGEKAFSHRLIPVIVGDSKDFPSERIPWIFNRLKTIRLSKDSENDDKFREIVKALKDAA